MRETRRVVIAGAGYAGLHVALRLAARLEGRRPDVGVTLVDKNPYHQLLTELPRLVGGSRTADDVAIPLRQVLDRRVRFVQAAVGGFDLPGRALLTSSEAVPYWRLVVALGSRTNDFGIPGLTERVLTLYSVDDAARVVAAVEAQVATAAGETDPLRQRRSLTVVIGGGGATGVELAGELAEALPGLARREGAPTEYCRVVLIEAGPTILAGSSPELVARANQLLADLGVEVRTNAAVGRVTEDGFVLKSGEVVEGGVLVWAGGVKAPEIMTGSGLPVGHNGRVNVDQYLRALDHPEIYVAGDVASVIDPETGRALPPLAQVALAEGEVVADNVLAELDDHPLQSFSDRSRGQVISVGSRRAVADVAGRTVGGRLAHLLKDAIEWEYRQSVRHLRGWSIL
jgi:NADH dehydrogenase